MNLSPLNERFVLHFGEMGSRWGVNRTVGQIYAVLFLSPEPMNADQIVDALGISRSNVSMGLKELQSWRLVKLIHQAGDRRDYFETPKDVWEIFRTLAEEKRKREIEPTLTLLRDALMETPLDEAERHAQQRMREMHQLIELATGWFDEVQRLSPDTLENLMRLGARVQKVLEFASFLRPGKDGKD
ncbi:DNA-binding transcriptional regulator GbsR (MarR family) [Crenobacter luteus]|uniref:HTH-type transcriptional regulator n=1 Tax=Crenobacter luteus TaxID=1452487 RepID=A0A161SB23_9NEIS|nr:GbsR/MarR family transcriptional regulator [Crenobacter luteus]KZE25273.1 ArsR family transcriptional regulator [Crenobacter luteus]TCP11589.1 DNA-binding transcriptional regulator GbsR (MarR family) [Crenobacter luteus]